MASTGYQRTWEATIAPTTWGQPVNAESPIDARRPNPKLQVGARHATAYVCPAVHNIGAQKTHEAATQFSVAAIGSLHPATRQGALRFVSERAGQLCPQLAQNHRNVMSDDVVSVSSLTEPGASQ